MASKKVVKMKKYSATLANKQAPCAFCNRMVDEETTYGKLYKIGDIHCHYFCVLLSCCLIQKGKDEDGLFGFLYHDILAEIERSKKHKCSYCSREGATLGCSVAQCRKQFHLPCGREKHAVSLFYGNYKTFCRDHAPKQKITDVVMAKAKLRLSLTRKVKRDRSTSNLKHAKKECSDTEFQPELQSVCVICYEAVEGFPTTQTFWPPCCARDAWFHRSCLERMALSAGIHYLKCPLCNDKDTFYKAVLSQGYYIPDRDAAWELEQNAFSDIYERPIVCTVEHCKCPNGRDFDADYGEWDIELCVLCGGGGAHAGCSSGLRVCADCRPAAPAQGTLQQLAQVPLPSQNNGTQRRSVGPIMPSRMSLRRTKGRQIRENTSAPSNSNTAKTETIDCTNNTETARLELNLKSPKKCVTVQAPLRTIENTMFSPLKLLKRDLYEKICKNNLVLDENVLDEVRTKFRRPKPLVVKKKIVNEILERFINNISKENTKSKEPIKEWNSPKKTYDTEEHNKITNDIVIKEEIPDLTDKNIQSKTMEVFKEINTSKDLNQNDDSNSTFQLPAEFVADYNSDQSLPIFDTPKKLKKVNVQTDRMEISSNDQSVNIDLVQIDNNDGVSVIPEQNDKLAFKLSTFNKEVLEKNSVDMDVESFKNQYLKEVLQFSGSKNSDLSSPVEEDGVKRPKKRRRTVKKDKVSSKRRKTCKSDDENGGRKRKIKVRKTKDTGDETKLSIRNKNINLKIQFKNEEVKLKISKSKKKSKKNKSKELKQYVLKYFNQNNQTGVIGKPDFDVVPKKRQYVKMVKSPDNLKQTSIDSFFRTKPVKP